MTKAEMKAELIQEMKLLIEEQKKAIRELRKTNALLKSELKEMEG